MSLLAHHNLVLSFVIHTECWSLLVVQKTGYDLPSVHPSNLISYHFSLYLFYFRHTGFLAISNMPRTFLFMASVLAISSSFFFRCPSFSDMLVSHAPFIQFSSQMSPQPGPSWSRPPDLKYILSLSIFLYWVYFISCVPPPHQNAGSVRVGSLSCPLPSLQHLEQCLAHSRPLLGIWWFETMNEYLGCFEFFETIKKVTSEHGEEWYVSYS